MTTTPNIENWTVTSENELLVRIQKLLKEDPNPTNRFKRLAVQLNTDTVRLPQQDQSWTDYKVKRIFYRNGGSISEIPGAVVGSGSSTRIVTATSAVRTVKRKGNYPILSHQEAYQRLLALRNEGKSWQDIVVYINNPKTGFRPLGSKKQAAKWKLAAVQSFFSRFKREFEIRGTAKPRTRRASNGTRNGSTKTKTVRPAPSKTETLSPIWVPGMVLIPKMLPNGMSILALDHENQAGGEIIITTGEDGLLFTLRADHDVVVHNEAAAQDVDGDSFDELRRGVNVKDKSFGVGRF